MTRSLLPALLLSLLLMGAPRDAAGTPTQKKPAAKKKPAAQKKPAAKKKPAAQKKPAKKKEPKLIANPGQWHRYQGRMIKQIKITGLLRTKVFRLKHLMDTRAGHAFDADTLRHDVRRIRNLQLFRPVRVRVEPAGKGVVVRIQTRDKWSLLPYFNMFFNLGSVSVITGIYDVNTLGFLSYVDLQVMLFSYMPVTTKSIRPGFLLNLQIPRLGGLPFSYYLSARAQMTLKTVIGTLLQPVGYFQVERYGGYHSLSWEPFQWMRVGVQQTLQYLRYKHAPDAEAPSVPLPETGLTHALALTGRLGYTSYKNYMQHGIVLSLALEGSTKHLGSDFDYLRFYGQCRAYYNFGPVWGNLAARVGGGYMKGGSYANLFPLGSWTGLRGFYTAQFTARSYIYGNVEYRTGLLRTGFPIMGIIPWFRGRVFQLQGAVFADVGGVAGGGAYRTDEHGKPLISIGAGIRAAVVNLYKAILRVDFAYTLSPYRSFDLIIATQQYF